MTRRLQGFNVVAASAFIAFVTIEDLDGIETRLVERVLAKLGA